MPEPTVPAAPAPAPATSRRRVVAAYVLAVAIDGLQFALLPFTLAGAAVPVVNAIDVATTIALTLLVGWHWAFLPTFLAEVLPVVELVPSWTLAVWIATRGRGKSISKN